MDIELNTIRYVYTKLDARTSFDVMRRLGNAVMIMQQELNEEHDPGARFTLGIISNAMQMIPQVDMDFILNSCLRHVRRDTGGKAPVAIINGQTGAMMFDDIDMGVMLELVDVVIQESLGPFFMKLRAAQEKVLDLPDLLSPETDLDMNPSS